MEETADKKDPVPAAEPSAPKRKWGQVIWTWTKRVCAGVGALFLLVFILFQFPAVQNWAARKAAAAISEKLGASVRADYLYIAFLDDLILEGLYVEDLNCDTLLYSGELTANINLNPVVWFKRGLEIEALGLKDAVLHLRRYPNEDQTNLDYVLDRLFPKDTTATVRKKGGFNLNLRQLELENIRFEKEDRARGNGLSIFLKQGSVAINSMNLPDQVLDVESVELSGPSINVSGWIGTLPDLEEPEEPEAPPDSTGLTAYIRHFTLDDGHFSLHNYAREPIKLSPADELDYRHMEVGNINIDIDSFSYSKEIFRGRVNGISLTESSGFVLNELSAQKALVSADSVMLADMKIITPYSQIGDTLYFRYPGKGYQAFENFEDDVRMDGRMYDASVAVRDIMTFAPGLKTNTFFQNNKDEVVQIDGRVSGQVNNLRGNDLQIVLSDGTLIKGSFGSRDLAVSQSQSLNLGLERLVTRMKTLRQLIPNFNPPENFDRLGRLDFSGRFDGFFTSFVAFGDLKTDIGRAKMDMQMVLHDNREKTEYSGNLSLSGFDLGAWTGNPDFGIVNFTSKVNNGVGLTPESASADLSASINSFAFKDYNYQSATISGKLSKNAFNGDFLIKDDNIDFAFNGKINYSDSIPVFDFKADVNKLDLLKLNLSKSDIILSGKLDLNLRSRNNTVEGRGNATGITLTHNGVDDYHIAYITAEDSLMPRNTHRFSLRSDMGEAYVEGQFDLTRIPNAFANILAVNYPEYAERFGIKPGTPEDAARHFTFEANVLDSKGLNWIVDPKLGKLDGLEVKGYYYGDTGSALVDLDLPKFRFGNVALADLAARVGIDDGDANFYLVVDSTLVNNNYLLSTINLDALVQRDTIEFGLSQRRKTENNTPVDNLQFDGFFYLKDSLNYEVRFKQSELKLLNEPWYIDANNYVSFGKDYFDTRNFKLESGGREIRLSKQGSRGALLDLRNFDFEVINDIWEYEPLNFDGRFNTLVTIENVFDLQGIEARLRSDTFLINQEDFGVLELSADVPDLKSKVEYYLAITKDTMQLTAKGVYNIDDLRQPTEKEKFLPSDLKKNYFNLTVDVSSYPLDIARFWTGDAITDIQGLFNADLNFSGQFSRPDVTGKILPRNGAFTVDYLKTRYSFKNGVILANNFMFDATGTILRDRYGHSAVLYGGFSHNHLQDLGVSARLRTSRFLGLDTKKGDNELFYGHALGSGFITFSGPFDLMDIYVNATVGDSTQLVIPVSNRSSDSKRNFRFLKKEEKKSDNNAREKITGISLEMELTVLEEAQMQIVFNEQTGDVIKGSGRGDIRIITPRGADFQMYGDYTIEEGNYLFTLYNVVNKDFRIKRGGQIRWSGDPFGAQIQLEAEYKDLRTSLAGFIQEYLLSAGEDVRQQASKQTEVALTLRLQGDLLKPIITFDLGFPDLRGQLQTYAENKLRLLKQDPNEMNRQVFGLIVVGQFLPSDLSFRGEDIFYNTVSEFLSNQLSLLLTQLFQDVIGEGKVLSGTDLDIVYSYNRNINLGDQNLSTGNEFEVSITQNLFNDRLTVQVGGNVVNNTLASGAFLGNDLVLEYALNEPRTLKVRIYQRLQPDIAGGRRLQIGAGLSYRKEFNNFKEFFEDMRKSVKNSGQ
ncbi:MAG: translocation/assembly module TamB domain-containing protein [Lewinellaceae bacterium]|nr:translocation/assembly module TamB domain-containing protein [Lewinella sp.]MCB9280375.1 translocation/assembly module TamB domain-containing protein [Lewinellaceae bacterium]